MPYLVDQIIARAVTFEIFNYLLVTESYLWVSLQSLPKNSYQSLSKRSECFAM